MGHQRALLLTASPCILCGGCERNRLDEETRIVRAAAPRSLVRCLRCGLVSVHPLPTSDELRSLYLDDAVMQQYREAHGRAYVMGDLEPEPHLGLRLEVLEGSLGGPGRILDVGAGSGVFLALARSRGWDVAGIELSRPAVQAARERLGIELVHGPMEENNFPNAAFDAVHISHVLEHFPDPLRALGEIRRVLRPGGVLVVEAPNEFDDLFGNIRSILGRPRQRYAVPSPHTYFFTPATLRALLSKAGFHILRLETLRRGRDNSSHLPLGGWVKRAIYFLESMSQRGPLIEVFAVPAHKAYGGHPKARSRREAHAAMGAREMNSASVEPAPNPRVPQDGVRVLMFTSLFHPVVGGSEGQALALARALVRRGHAVTVVTQQLPRLPAHEVVAGIHVYREIRPLGSRSIAYGISYVLSSALALLRHRRQSQIIHVHHLYLDAFLAALLGRIMRRPVVAKVACGGYVGDMARLKRTRLAGLLFAGTRRVDRIVAVSSQIQEELIEHRFAAERIVRIPNGIDTERFHSPRDRAAAKHALALQGKVVSFIGRLDPQKGLPHLLKAWSAVVARRADTRLLLVGTGPQEGELMRLAEELRVSGHVDFLGYRSDVRPYLQASDIFVLPSLAEGMSNVLLEAMATGLACVATRIGGNTDLVEDDVNGVLVEPADGAGLAKAILRLVQSDADAARLGVAARERVEREYSIKVIADRYVRLYEELLGAAG